MKVQQVGDEREGVPGTLGDGLMAPLLYGVPTQWFKLKLMAAGRTTSGPNNASSAAWVF